jgi:hypothetical protein
MGGPKDFAVGEDIFEPEKRRCHFAVSVRGVRGYTDAGLHR